MFKKKKNEDETGLEPGADVPAGPGLSAIDIQQQEFRQAFRGYNEKDVDEFLDTLTEAYARLSEENKRLRSGAGLPAAGGDPTASADAIRAQAQQEASAVLADARTRAAAMGAVEGSASGGEKAAVQGFLKQERDFLHGMAGTIQKHADTIREMAKTFQQQIQASASTGAATSAVPGTPGAGSAVPSPNADVPEAAQSAESASTAPAPESSVPVAPPVMDSAWTATASPAAAPVATAPVVTETETETETETVISIPPSEVDTPTGETPAIEAPIVETPAEVPSVDDASFEQAEASFGQTEASAEMQVEGPDAPKPQEQRSLRELFWGEE
ncbi:MAG: DivIVA domain-containing protein [Actinomycetota bacterium]